MDIVPIFEFKDVSYRYGQNHVALDGVSLRIAAGESVALLGANGSGKSTLLKLMDGLYEPSGGTARILGVDLKTLESDAEQAYELHRRIGLVFQDPDIQLFSATVGDDVAFGPLQLGLALAEVRSRVEAALAQMDIGHLRDRAPFELSGGEKKRAAIASVLSLEPEILLFDEPTASLDPRTKWALVSLIEQFARENKTIVTTTHELDIVPFVARRVVVIGENRRVLADGATETILSDTSLLLEANLIHPRQLGNHGPADRTDGRTPPGPGNSNHE